jgi:two-component system NarL family sensor kinase
MLGTGLYLDDIEQTLKAWRTERRPTFRIRSILYLIAAAAMVLIALAGLAVNVSDHRVSAPNSSIWPSAWSIPRKKNAPGWRKSCTDGIIQVLVF